MLEGVDVSYAQGAYRPGAEAFVICNASRANVGLVVGSMYWLQVANARAAGKHVGHYFFNGNVDPVTCADFFVSNLAYQPGDSLWLDVESEPGTGTVAWSPGQALAFVNRVKTRMGVAPGIYLNQSLMNGSDWSAVVAAGSPLWIAYYNPTPPAIKWWPTWTLWQYTSNPIDRDRSQGDTIASLGATLLEDDLTPEQDNKLTQIFNAIFFGGDSMPDSKRPLDLSVKLIGDAVDLIKNTVTQPVIRDGSNVTQIQDNADTGSLVRQLVASVAALQAAVSALSVASGSDPGAIEAAAFKGAQDALAGLTLKSVPTDFNSSAA